MLGAADGFGTVPVSGPLDWEPAGACDLVRPPENLAIAAATLAAAGSVGGA